VTLSASNSLYASSYAWTIVSTPVGATASLSSTTATQPVLTANMNGDYVLQLVVANGSTQSDPEQVTITIDSALTPAQTAIVFSDIKAVLQAAETTTCVGCHEQSIDGSAFGGIPPIYYGRMTVYPTVTDFDRDGDSDVDADDEFEYYTAVRGRVNFTDVTASPLLRKPTGNHHYGGHVLDFSNVTACAAPCSGYATWGDYYRAQYNLLVNWIVNGAPYN
jgi:hypothetical protein